MTCGTINPFSACVPMIPVVINCATTAECFGDLTCEGPAGKAVCTRRCTRRPTAPTIRRSARVLLRARRTSASRRRQSGTSAPTSDACLSGQAGARARLASSASARRAGPAPPTTSASTGSATCSRRPSVVRPLQVVPSSAALASASAGGDGALARAGDRVALVVIVRSLDRPWMKRRLQAMAHDKTGLEVDWTETHVALFSGLRIERLVVMTPPALRDRAPELLRARRDRGAVDGAFALVRHAAVRRAARRGAGADAGARPGRQHVAVDGGPARRGQAGAGGAAVEGGSRRARRAAAGRAHRHRASDGDGAGGDARPAARAAARRRAGAARDADARGNVLCDRRAARHGGSAAHRGGDARARRRGGGGGAGALVGRGDSVVGGGGRARRARGAVADAGAGDAHQGAPRT